VASRATGSPPTPADGRVVLSVLFGAGASVALGQTGYFTVLSPLGREIGLDEVQIGALVSASSVVFFFGSTVWGRISDRWGRKPVLLVGLLGYTLGTLVFASGFLLAQAGLLGTTAAFAYLVLARMGQSALMSATPPASTAYVADVTEGAARTRGLGLMGAAQNFGSIIGPGVAGLLVAFGLLVPVYFASVCTAVAAVAVWWWLAPHPAGVRRATGAPVRRPVAFTDPRILPFLLAGVTLFTGFSLIQQTLPFRMQDALGLDGRATASLFGTAMIVSAASSLVSQLVVVRRFAHAPLTLLRLAVPLVLGAFAILVSTAAPWAFFGAMVLMGLGMGMGMAGPGFVAAASLAVGAEEQGSVAGYTSACPALGFTIGPLTGTWLYGVEATGPYWLGLALYAILFAFLLRLRVRPAIGTPERE
jgi:MFS family permease